MYASNQVKVYQVKLVKRFLQIGNKKETMVVMQDDRQGYYNSSKFKSGYLRDTTSQVLCYLVDWFERAFSKFD